MFAVFTHSPVKFSGNKHPGSTNFDRTGFNLILSGALMDIQDINETHCKPNIMH